MGQPISIKLATEVGLGEIFQRPEWFCCLPFSSRVSGEVLLEASKSWKNMLLQG